LANRERRDSAGPHGTPPLHTSRLNLVWDVSVFQFKLVMDGVRDLLLSPISMAAAIYGLVAGGDDPARYFRRLMRLGRRSDRFINLFGHGSGAGTSDELMDGLRDRVFTQATTNPWLNQAGTRLNAGLDRVNSNRAGGRAERPAMDDGAGGNRSEESDSST
jgi:hypothetical protein